MAYYLDRHIPMVAQLLGGALKGMNIEQGVAGGQPGVAAPYVALCHLAFDSIDAFQSAFDKHSAQIVRTDTCRYTELHQRAAHGSDQPGEAVIEFTGGRVLAAALVLSATASMGSAQQRRAHHTHADTRE